MDIRRIQFQDTFSLREKFLVSDYEPNSFSFRGDDDEQTFHLGAFVNTQDKRPMLISVASFFFEKHPLIPGDSHYRLRGMCTASEYRNKGFSSQLLKTAMPIIKQNFCQAIWCEAQIQSVEFYKKVGMQAYGKSFFLSSLAIEHILMVRILDKNLE
jgi:predicted GNAT family N-acyltransferase